MILNYFRSDRRVNLFILCQKCTKSPLVLPPPPYLRQCIALFVVAERGGGDI